MEQSREPLKAALASVEENKKVGQPRADPRRSEVRAGVTIPYGAKAVRLSRSARCADEAAATVSLFTTSLQFQIPLDAVRPGRYIAQVTVVALTGQRFAYERTALLIAR